ncbi:TniQ family protein [Bacillus cereus]|uniref:TniQ family protein n=1 Tax=Bacillus cereus TaxID=1396 RepID=UPI000A30210D|nr:TniQ family protein [Bacillus cereus]MDZ4458966.1 TniQ family protein [Bacillus cereus]MDZ4577193.1 TniQ family protein [Bacillus cereus]MDZ4624965.1 TniQ family protein [Bacillus cereus]SME09276.1 hypothetical protein BACERE00188_02562 [Bacillus cereus]HDR8396197.1 TniQ family protein [Bacillus cereus]
MGIQSIDQEIRNEHQVNISTLYSIEPIGVGTPYVESLISYIARIAYEHSILPGMILRNLLAETLQLNYLKEHYQNGAVLVFMKKFCGINSISMDIVQALERVTMRNDIIFLTLNPLKNLFNGRNVVGGFRKWCPCCLNDWKSRGEIIYEPLLWKIDSITYCPSHQCILQNECFKCKKKLKVFNSRIQNGFCPHCWSWLGNGNAKSVSVDINSRVVVDNYCELLERMKEDKTIFTRDKGILILNQIKEILNYNNVELAEVFNVHPRVFGGWLNGRGHPNIDRYLEFAYKTNSSVYKVFIKQDFSSIYDFKTSLDKVNKRKSIEEKIFNIRITGSKKKLNLERLKEMLLYNLNQENPLNLLQIQKKYRIDRRTIKKYFPEIFQKYIKLTQYDVNKRNKIYVKQLKDEEKTFNQICDGRSSQYAYLYNKFPELVKIKVHSRAQKIVKRQEEVKRMLTKILDEKLHVELNLREIADKYGYNYTCLYKRCSELCKKIAKRHKEFRKEQRSKRMQQTFTKIQEIAVQLHNDNQYPSTTKIAKAMDNKYLFMREEPKLFHKKILKELGYIRVV